MNPGRINGPIHADSECGFTLIEIVAVIIIMGILAAVAVPRFFSMQENANIATLNGALSEAATRFNHAYAKFILVEKRAPTSVINELDTSDYLGVNAACCEDIGDFVVSWQRHSTDGLAIIVLTADSIAQSALDSLPDTIRTKTITGISW